MANGAPDYTKITLLKGAAPDGSLVTLAVDASGNILAVLKGEYGGVLKTVQTDANGLLLAKIYDPDDIFGVSGTIGLGELAARLGSIMCFDRRGQVVWYDDFEAGTLKWLAQTLGAGAAVALDNTNAFLKSQSVKLTAGSDGSMKAYITKHLSLQGAGRVGAEFTLGYDQSLQPDQVRFDLVYYSGANVYQAQVIWDMTNSIIKILLDFAPTYAIIATNVSPLSWASVWMKLKLVADFSTGKYVRLLYGTSSADLSAYSIPSQVSSTPSHIFVDVHNFGKAGSNCVCWIDDVVLTYQEP